MKTQRNKTPRALSFHDAESQCKLVFRENGPFFHLCTPGEQTEILFEDEEDYITRITYLQFPYPFPELDDIEWDYETFLQKIYRFRK